MLFRSTGALPVGQEPGSDRVTSHPIYPMGRLHAHKVNGKWETHFDAFDPDKGILYALGHGILDVVPALGRVASKGISNVAKAAKETIEARVNRSRKA